MRLSILGRLTSLVAIVLLAWPPSPVTAGAQAQQDCPPGSEVNLGDFIVWVDAPGGGSADVPVWVAYPCDLPRMIVFKTYDMSAKAGVDYVAVNQGSVVLAAGATSTSIRIQILDKDFASPDKTFGVVGVSGVMFGDRMAVVTIKAG